MRLSGSRAGEALFEPAIAAALGFDSVFLFAEYRSAVVTEAGKVRAAFIVHSQIEHGVLADFKFPVAFTEFDVES